MNDDAFISFRYADNLVRLGELTYNVGNRVEGYTNFLWTLILAGVLALKGDPVFWSKFPGVGSSVGTLLVVAAFSQATARGTKRSSLWSGLAPLLLAASAPFACWSEGGLETALFTFLCTAGVFRYILEDADPRRVPGSAPLLTLAAMTRPEGILVLGTLVLCRAVIGLTQRRLPLRRDFIWAAIFVALWGAYWGWRTLYHGYLFPNTFYVKAGTANWTGGITYLRDWSASADPWVVLPASLLLWAGSRPARRALFVLGSVVTVLVIHVTRAGGDFMALHRFFVPFYPLLAVIVQEGLFGLWNLAQATTSHRVRPVFRHGTGATLLALFAAGVAAHGLSTGAQALRVETHAGIDSIGQLKQYVKQ